MTMLKHWQALLAWQRSETGGNAVALAYWPS